MKFVSVCRAYFRPAFSAWRAMVVLMWLPGVVLASTLLMTVVSSVQFLAAL